MTATTARPQASPATSAEPIITVRELVKSYGSQAALNGIDLVIPRGVIVGVIGPSGCGKTTLIRSLTGIESPTSGEVRVFGRDPRRFSARDRIRFGYMPQLPILFPNISVKGNLGFISSIYGIPMRGRRQRVRELLDLVDLLPHRHKQLAECSGGMQRRLTLAATLAHEPELLYLDEPTAGVDPILRERFWAHFRDLRDQGRTIIVPTQYVGEAFSCDFVAVMAAGRLLTVQAPDQLGRVAFGGDVLAVHFDGVWVRGEELARLRQFDFVGAIERSEDRILVVVEDAQRDEGRLRDHFESTGIAVSKIEPHEPNFDDVFVRLIERLTTAEERAAA